MEHAASVAEFFDSYASDFNAIYGNRNTLVNRVVNRYLRSSMRIRFEKTIEGCQPIEGRSVVDIGTGPGHYAIMLAKHILTEDVPPGVSAIELGTGLGLVSIAAAAGGWRVLATDHDPTALRFAAYNAAMNNVRIERFELLDWHHPPDPRSFDRVLAADVLYELKDHTAILKCVDRLLAPDGSAMIADPNRGIADRFPALAMETGFHVDIRQAHAPRTGGEEVDGRIFTLRRRRPQDQPQS